MHGSAAAAFLAMVGGGATTTDTGPVLRLTPSGLDFGAVDQWDDETGNGNHAIQPVAGKRPTVVPDALNGHPAVRFDGVDDSLRADGVAGALSGNDVPHTFLIVFKYAELTENGFYTWLSFGAPNNSTRSDFHGRFQDPTLAMFRHGRVGDSGGAAGVNGEIRFDSRWHALVFTSHGSTLDVWLDGQLALDRYPYGAGLATFDKVTIGALGRLGEQNFFQGDIAELAVWPRALGDPEIAGVMDYCLDRYGLGDPPPAPRFSRAPASVEVMNPRTATEIAAGLGFGTMHPARRWMLERGKELGMSSPRVQIAWGSTGPGGGVESFDRQLTLPPQWGTWLDWCRELDLEPIVVAGYAPPYQEVGKLTLAAPLVAGTRDLVVLEDLTGVAPGSHIRRVRADADNNAFLTDRGTRSYGGSFMHAVDPARKTITMAAKAHKTVPLGTELVVNRYLYPPINSLEPDDPSVVAYCRYVRFLAGELHRHGVTGTIELWNEPPWPNDVWDAMPAYYDDPSLISTYDLRVRMSPVHEGILANLLNGPAFPDGVRCDHAGTHKTGTGSIFSWLNPTREQLERSIESQSFHPYSELPEGHGGVPPYYTIGQGMSATSNFRGVFAQLQGLRPVIGPGFSHRVTEIGNWESDEVKATRHNLRQFLFYMGCDFKRLHFFGFADAHNAEGDPRWVEATPGLAEFVRFRYKALAMKHLMGAVARIAGDTDVPVAALPTVRQWSGPVPLSVLPIRGTDRTVLWVSWQRSHAQPWFDSPSPAPGQVTIEAPPGTKVVQAWNLVTREPLVATAEPDRGVTAVRYVVTDDPVAIELRLRSRHVPR